MADVTVLDRPVMTAREACPTTRHPTQHTAALARGRSPPRNLVQPGASRGADRLGGHHLGRTRRGAVPARLPSEKRVDAATAPAIGALRREFGVPYPLAHFKPFVDSRRRFLLQVQEEAQLPTQLTLVYEHRSGQLVLDPRITDFLDRVDFSPEGELEALRLYPAGRNSPVVIQPTIASAAAAVHGVRTENLVELADSGVPVADIADDFGLPVADVKAALAYEWSKAA